jgi:uncharacterized protein (DUF58 family)
VPLTSASPAPPLSPGRSLATRLAVALTRDYCPQADRYLFLRSPLGAVLAGLLAAGLCGAFLNPQAYLLAAGLGAIAALGLAWPAIAVAGLEAELSAEADRVREGDAVRLHLRVSNRWPWPAWGLGVRCGRDDGVAEPIVCLTAASGWRTTTAAATVRPTRRGEYPRGPVWIGTAFPFGLWTARRQVRVAERLLVWPRTFPLSALPEEVGERQALDCATSPRSGTAGEVAGTRPYRAGDALRRVHWGQTARHDRLIVCERQAAACPWVRVVLDDDAAVHAGSGPDSTLEWAVRIAASLCESLHAQGVYVEARFGGDTLAIQPRGRGLRTALDRLARLTPERVAETHPSSGPLRSDRGGLCIAISTDCRERFATNRSREEVLRWIVLRAEAFAGQQSAVDPRVPPAQAWIDVRSPSRAAADVQRGWERACHAS